VTEPERNDCPAGSPWPGAGRIAQIRRSKVDAKKPSAFKSRISMNITPEQIRILVYLACRLDREAGQAKRRFESREAALAQLVALGSGPEGRGDDVKTESARLNKAAVAARKKHEQLALGFWVMNQIVRAALETGSRGSSSIDMPATPSECLAGLE
jgi:hypothetical protein